MKMTRCCYYLYNSLIFLYPTFQSTTHEDFPTQSGYRIRCDDKPVVCFYTGESVFEFIDIFRFVSIFL